MANKRKIAIIGLKGLPAFGGAAAAGEHIIEQLASEYDFTIYATESHTSHRGLYKGANQIVFKRFPIRSLNVLYYYMRSALHVVTNKYDLVHLHQMDAAFILLLLRLRYKVVATSHGLTYKTGKWSKLLYPYFKMNEWMQASLSNHLTVVAKSLVAHYATIVSDRKITYIPNGINLSTTSENNPEHGDYLLFAAGRIISIKGLHLLLPALRNINYKGKLIVLGDLDQIKDYKAEIQALSEGLNVEYKGLIKDKAKLNSYIAGAKLFVFPSTQEAMSMMLLEVASLKTPIISSDIVENTDIFTESDVRFFKSRSVDDLA
jgi:glycosyltransferase involved in cell wall biosynthesis